MGKSGKEHLNRVLVSHLNNIHETFQVLDDTPASTLDKVEWKEVITMGEQVSKQATVAGMLWTGDHPDLKSLEENMGVYFNMLQGFLLLTHGSTIGAGPTLSSCIHASAKQVVDNSFSFFKEAVSSYGYQNKDRKLSLPQLAGTVWEACDSLKKTPTTNYTAIGRAITQVAVSIKDVLRELKDLKPGSTDPTNDTLDESVTETSTHHDEDVDGSSEGDLGNDLSPEDMKIAESAISVVSDTLVIIKELIRFITGLLRQSNPNNSKESVDSLERLLKLCQEIGVQIDELGACLYPPQEVPALKVVAEKISDRIREIQAEVHRLEGSCDSLLQACEGLDSSLRKLQTELGSSETNLLSTEMQNLAVSSV